MQIKTVVPFLTVLFLAPVVGCGDDEGDADDTTASETDASETNASDTEASDTEASDTDDSDTDDSEDTMTNDDPLALIGEYTDDFGGGHSVSMTVWVQTADFGTFTYTLGSYDNDAMWVVGEDTAAEEGAAFSRFDWTVDDSGQMWFCTAAFGAATEQDAIDAPASDPSDPASTGCGMMFPWSQLNPV